MTCLGVVMRWAVLAAVTLVVTPGLYAQQSPALAGVRMIDLVGRAAVHHGFEPSQRLDGFHNEFERDQNARPRVSVRGILMDAFLVKMLPFE